MTFTTLKRTAGFTVLHDEVLATLSYSALIQCEGAKVVYIMSDVADVEIRLPDWKVATTEWQTTGANSKLLAYVIATNTNGIHVDPTATAVGIAQAPLPPVIQLYNGNVGAAEIKVVIVW